MAKDDKIALFRDECRAYPYYLTEINKYDDKLAQLQNRMEGVYSPVTDRIGSTPTPHELDYIEIIQQKEELERYRQFYIDMTRWVLDVISDITSPAYKALVWATYVQKIPLQSIADKYMIGKDKLYRIRRKHLQNALSEQRMQEYTEIMTRRPPDPDADPYM